MVSVRAVRVVARPAVAATSGRRGDIVGGTSRHTKAAVVVGYCKGVVHGIWGGRQGRRISIWR